MEPSLDWRTVGWCWITVDGPAGLWPVGWPGGGGLLHGHGERWP